MIAYKIEIIVDEEHEADFDDIIKTIYEHAERIDGVEQVYGITESYFEYNEDINYEEEEDDKTDREIVDIIKGTETATFTLPMMGSQKLPTERLKFLVEAWWKRGDAT